MKVIPLAYIYQLAKFGDCIFTSLHFNLGQNQESLVKDYRFSNDEAEILIVDAVKANAIKSVIFNGKKSYRIVKTNNVSDAAVLFPDTQEEAPEGITTEDT